MGGAAGRDSGAREKDVARFVEQGEAEDIPAGREPLGIIDIGSNSVRLVVYDGAVRAAAPLFNEKVLCGLGRSVASTGKLGRESTERALSALARFHAIARILGVKNLRAIATAAVREASDGRDFIARGEKAAGVRIEVLSGEKEAALAASGIRMGFTSPSGIAGDLGGGSLELIDISGETLNEAATLPLGGLRLIDTTGDKLDKALSAADAEVGRVGWLSKGKGRIFYAVGGTWRALAKMHMEGRNYPLRVMHGYAIPAAEAIAFCETVRRARKLTQLPGIAEVARARREVLPYGALVLERVLKAIEPSEVVFSVFGIREGLLFDLLPPHERAKDPLICFCKDYAQMRSRSAEHAGELCAWTDAIFSAEGPNETPAERRLRHAACLLSDIGWRAHPDYRGEQSLNVIAHAGLAGIEHEGRIFLALSVYYRHAGGDSDGPDHFSERLRQTVDKRVQKRARITGAAIRTAHMLSIGTAGVIDECPLNYEGRQIVLTLPPQHADLDGERLRRRFEGLAALLDRDAVVRVTGKGKS
jgi:exopolyphosphatase/guanosine-5'-triphosphate,3'-diphosphate pyrophosphatase